jgi:hypothetical protein
MENLTKGATVLGPRKTQASPPPTIKEKRAIYSSSGEQNKQNILFVYNRELKHKQRELEAEKD